MNTNHRDLWEKLQDDIRWFLDYSKDRPIPRFSKSEHNTRVGYGTAGTQMTLGKLSLKEEAAGKVRVFAIVDA
jgi:hypothetical protein